MLFLVVHCTRWSLPPSPTPQNRKPLCAPRSIKASRRANSAATSAAPSVPTSQPPNVGGFGCEMACYRPTPVFRLGGGGISFAPRHGEDVVGHLDLPCRGCIGCRLDRAADWATRLGHERKLHLEAAWVTLTYSDENLPRGGTLEPRHLSDFIRRLRKIIAPTPIRFFGCGEYGDTTERAHYHVCIFGYDFPDKTLFTKNKHGTLWESELLSRAWPLGHAVTAALTTKSMAYTARYSMKKINGDLAHAHYTRIDDQGVMHSVHPEFARMSNRPGIGAGFFDRFKSDLYPHDYTVVDGRRTKVPPYYDRLLKREDPDTIRDLKEKRADKARERASDQTHERLAVREIVATARASQSKRTL